MFFQLLIPLLSVEGQETNENCVFDLAIKVCPSMSYIYYFVLSFLCQRLSVTGTRFSVSAIS